MGAGGGCGGQGYLAVSVVPVHRCQLQLQAGHLGQQLQLLGLQGRAVQQLLRWQPAVVKAPTGSVVCSFTACTCTNQTSAS